MRQRDTHVMDGRPDAPGDPAGFEAFVLATEPRLRRALVAAYGYEDGREAAAEALAYAWEHWARVRRMPNAAGYLFRVARSSAARGRRWRRSPPLLTLNACPDSADRPFHLQDWRDDQQGRGPAGIPLPGLRVPADAALRF